MVTTHGGAAPGILFAKGALERLLPRCTTMIAAGAGPVPIDCARVEAVANALAADGQRVLVIARGTAGGCGGGDDPGGLTLLGLAGMIDPPRPKPPAWLKK